MRRFTSLKYVRQRSNFRVWRVEIGAHAGGGGVKPRALIDEEFGVFDVVFLSEIPGIIAGRS